jgi:hypothetical protein
MNKFALIAVSWAFTAPAWAHHSAAAVYDVDKTFTVEGTITKVEWLNPHVRFYVDVKDADGKVTNYEFETSGPGGFLRRGMGRDTLKIGDPIKVTAYPARNGSPMGVAVDTTLADGRKLGGGASDGKEDY